MTTRLDGHTYTIPEMARLLGIAERTAYVWAKRDGALAGVPAITVGRTVRFAKAKVDATLGIRSTKKRPHPVQRTTARD